MKTYGGGGIAPRILDIGTRRWVVSFTPRPLYPRGKIPRYPLYGWAPEPVWTLWKRRIPGPRRESNPNRPARSQFPYRLSYPGSWRQGLRPIPTLYHRIIGLPKSLLPVMYFVSVQSAVFFNCSVLSKCLTVSIHNAVFFLVLNLRFNF
jgi:hypothetical protein